MAVTPASSRSWRNRASSAALFLPPFCPPFPLAAGSTGEVRTMAPLPRAASTAATPPGRAAITLASPPAAGSSHSELTSSAEPLVWALPTPGSGRFEVNSSDPSGRKRGLPSPSADRVSRRAGPPCVSIRQMLVRYFFRSALSVCTAAASQLPSGASRKAPTRGMAAKSLRSPNGVGVSALTVTAPG